MAWSKTWMLAAVIAISCTAFAIGKGSGSAGNVVLCADKQDGDVTLASHGKCDHGAKSVKLAKRGPAGPPGAQGEPGQDGTTASLQPEGAHVIGPATTNCATHPGAFCDSDECGRWISPDAPTAPASYRKDAEGFVHLEGAATGRSASGACGASTRDFTYLPTGYRPNGTLHFSAASCDGSGVTPITVDATGLVEADTVVTCIDLSAVTFHAAG
jgi:hypothetical protein